LIATHFFQRVDTRTTVENGERINLKEERDRENRDERDKT
jgi:hypothetical protein